MTFGWCLELVLGFMEWWYAIKLLALAYFMTNCNEFKFVLVFASL